MKKIRLSDADVQFFELELSPFEYTFFCKHKDVFKCMWNDQGKPFWTKFTITFRSFTVKHGVIKQMSSDANKLESLLDDAFIYIYENFVEGREKNARNFIDDCGVLARNYDKLPQLDSPSFTRDPFYTKDTREIFRRFFGQPDDKESYVKVYVLMPIFLRYSGSVCRCLKRWMNTTELCDDDSYWTPPKPLSAECNRDIMCMKCLDACSENYNKETNYGSDIGPMYVEGWDEGDPRYNDPRNPLYSPSDSTDIDWRKTLTPEIYYEFVQFCRVKYKRQCPDCIYSLEELPSLVPCDSQECGKKKKRRRKKKSSLKGENEIMEYEDPRLMENSAGILDMIANYKATEKYKDGNSRTKDLKLKKNNPNFGGLVRNIGVLKKEDELCGASEIIVTISGVQEQNGINSCKRKYVKKCIRNCGMSLDFFYRTIPNISKGLLYLEGSTYCACSLLMGMKENTEDIFNLKVSGSNMVAVRETFINLMTYFGKRRGRGTKGWSMNEEDVVASLMPDEKYLDEKEMTILMQRGMGVENMLTNLEDCKIVKNVPEKRMETRHYMVLSSDVAKRIFESSPSLPNQASYVKQKFRAIYLRVHGHCINPKSGYGTENYTKTFAKLVKINKERSITDFRDLEPGIVTFMVQEMYETACSDIDNFETMFEVDIELFDKLRYYGLKIVDKRKKNASHPCKPQTCYKCLKILDACKCFEMSDIKVVYGECNCFVCKEPETDSKGNLEREMSKIETSSLTVDLEKDSKKRYLKFKETCDEIFGRIKERHKHDWMFLDALEQRSKESGIDYITEAWLENENISEENFNCCDFMADSETNVSSKADTEESKKCMDSCNGNKDQSTLGTSIDMKSDICMPESEKKSEESKIDCTGDACLGNDKNEVENSTGIETENNISSKAETQKLEGCMESCQGNKDQSTSETPIDMESDKEEISKPCYSQGLSEGNMVKEKGDNIITPKEDVTEVPAMSSFADESVLSVKDPIKNEGFLSKLKSYLCQPNVSQKDGKKFMPESEKKLEESEIVCTGNACLGNENNEVENSTGIDTEKNVSSKAGTKELESYTESYQGQKDQSTSGTSIDMESDMEESSKPCNSQSLSERITVEEKVENRTDLKQEEAHLTFTLDSCSNVNKDLEENKSNGEKMKENDLNIGSAKREDGNQQKLGEGSAEIKGRKEKVVNEPNAESEEGTDQNMNRDTANVNEDSVSKEIIINRSNAKSGEDKEKKLKNCNPDNKEIFVKDKELNGENVEIENDKFEEKIKLNGGSTEKRSCFNENGEENEKVQSTKPEAALASSLVFPEHSLRKCACCLKLETSPKAFKKCKRCVQEYVQKTRYYCGRECQAKDWSERHKEEHLEYRVF